MISHLQGESKFGIATEPILTVASLFILTGIIPHLKDLRNKPEIQLQFRATTPLIAFGVFELLVIIELLLQNGDRFIGLEIQKDLLSGLEIADQGLIILTSSNILAVIGIILSAFWLCQQKVKEIESYHEMIAFLTQRLRIKLRNHMLAALEAILLEPMWLQLGHPGLLSSLHKATHPQVAPEQQ